MTEPVARTGRQPALVRRSGDLASGDRLAQALQEPFEPGHAFAQPGDFSLDPIHNTGVAAPLAVATLRAAKDWRKVTCIVSRTP